MRFLESLLSSKIFVITLLALPVVWMAWPLLNGNLAVAADPLKFILHHLGFTASVILAIVLSLSPLRAIFPKSRLVLALNRHRRLIGVTVFVYVLLHVTAHFLYEGGFGTFPADLKKPFFLSGLVAATILFLMAITSLNRAVRWMARAAGNGCTGSSTSPPYWWCIIRFSRAKSFPCRCSIFSCRSPRWSCCASCCRWCGGAIAARR